MGNSTVDFYRPIKMMKLKTFFFYDKSCQVLCKRSGYTNESTKSIIPKVSIFSRSGSLTLTGGLRKAKTDLLCCISQRKELNLLVTT